nr:AAA family ATPase [Providencia sp. 1701091]
MKNYITENSLCSIYGPSGSYKSFLAISWACHIATGIEWSGNRVNPGVVIYIVGEGG